MEIFPENLKSSNRDCEYYYYNRDILLDPMCQIYLKCKYDAKDRFYYDTYVAMYNWSSAYEYAIIDQDKLTIIYISHKISTNQMLNLIKNTYLWTI